MFRLDDQFLKDIGLEGLPDEQKQPFLQHIYSELELRVGTRLSDGLSDAQLEEFEEIIDRKEDKIQAWLARMRQTLRKKKPLVSCNKQQIYLRMIRVSWLNTRLPSGSR